MAQELSVVGKRLPRPDVAAKATGEARYIVDIKLPGMLTGKVLRSPYPHARIVKVDKSKAEKLPGVEAVITFENVPKKIFNQSKLDQILVHREAEVKDQYVLTDKARYIGDAVAAVAAINESTAEEALELIEVEYEELPAVFDPIEAMKPDAPRIHDFAELNIAKHYAFPAPVGEVEKGFHEADCVVEETFINSRQKFCQMEPSACVASFDTTGRLTVWSPSQHPFLHRRKIAELFDIPEGMIRWMTPSIGGGFGKGGSFRAEPICITLAEKTGKPVKLEFTREEEFIATESRQPYIQWGKIGVKKDGTITALQTKVITDAGAYFTHSGSTTSVNLNYFMALYRCPNLNAEADIVYTNTPVSGGMRGYGNPGAMWVLEQLVDMAAEGIGMDPLEFRLKNHKRAGEPGRLSVPIETCALAECIEIGAKKIGWREKRGSKGEGRLKRGVGMAVMRHGSAAYPFIMQAASAFIKLNEDGSANLVIGPSELGQGILGAMSQIAAEELGLCAEDIHIVTGDTDVTPFDVGQHASRSTYCMGNAVLRAAAEVKQQLLERASKALEVSAEEMEVRDGQIYVKAMPEKGTSVAEIARDAIYNFKGEVLQITGKCTFEPRSDAPPFQAAFAEVEVDTETGEVKVARIIVAHDIGRAINPMSAEGQLEGSVVMGIGFTLLEDYVVNKNNGNVESDNFTTYKIPSTLDLPETEVIIIEQPDPSGPFGAKSVGESGLVAIAPAIANAIYDAVGIRIKDLPVTPEKVLKALKSK